MKTIQEPEFNFVRYTAGRLWGEDQFGNAIKHLDFEQWFKENIKGKLVIDADDVVEVYGTHYDSDMMEFSRGCDADDVKQKHKALLILSSIEEIEKESCEERYKRGLDLALRAFEMDDHSMYLKAKKLMEEK